MLDLGPSLQAFLSSSSSFQQGHLGPKPIYFTTKHIQIGGLSRLYQNDRIVISPNTSGSEVWYILHSQPPLHYFDTLLL